MDGLITPRRQSVVQRVTVVFAGLKPDTVDEREGRMTG